MGTSKTRKGKGNGGADVVRRRCCSRGRGGSTFGEDDIHPHPALAPTPGTDQTRWERRSLPRRMHGSGRVKHVAGGGRETFRRAPNVTTHGGAVETVPR